MHCRLLAEGSHEAAQRRSFWTFPWPTQGRHANETALGRTPVVMPRAARAAASGAALACQSQDRTPINGTCHAGRVSAWKSSSSTLRLGLHVICCCSAPGRLFCSGIAACMQDSRSQQMCYLPQQQADRANAMSCSLAATRSADLMQTRIRKSQLPPYPNPRRALQEHLAGALPEKRQSSIHLFGISEQHNNLPAASSFKHSGLFRMWNHRRRKSVGEVTSKASVTRGFLGPQEKMCQRSRLGPRARLHMRPRRAPRQVLPGLSARCHQQSFPWATPRPSKRLIMRTSCAWPASLNSRQQVAQNVGTKFRAKSAEQ